MTKKTKKLSETQEYKDFIKKLVLEVHDSLVNILLTKDDMAKHFTEMNAKLDAFLDYLAIVNAGVVRNGRKLDLILKNRLSYEELAEIAKMEAEFKDSMEKLKN